MALAPTPSHSLRFPIVVVANRALDSRSLFFSNKHEMVPLGTRQWAMSFPALMWIQLSFCIIAGNFMGKVRNRNHLFTKRFERNCVSCGFETAKMIWTPLQYISSLGWVVLAANVAVTIGCRRKNQFNDWRSSSKAGLGRFQTFRCLHCNRCEPDWTELKASSQNRMGEFESTQFRVTNATKLYQWHPQSGMANGTKEEAKSNSSFVFTCFPLFRSNLRSKIELSGKNVGQQAKQK